MNQIYSYTSSLILIVIVVTGPLSIQSSVFAQTQTVLRALTLLRAQTLQQMILNLKLRN